MPSPKEEVIELDLDAVLATRIQSNKDSAVIIPFTLLGKTWHATSAPSVVAVLAAMRLDDSGVAALNFLLSMIVEDEQQEFETLLARTPGMDGEMFSEIINLISEKVAGRPTESPSDSSRTSGNRKSGARSTANSSSVAVGDSLD